MRPVRHDGNALRGVMNLFAQDVGSRRPSTPIMFLGGCVAAHSSAISHCYRDGEWVRHIDDALARTPDDDPFWGHYNRLM